MANKLQPRVRVPHWGWILLLTVTLVIAAIGLSIWLPWHREQRIADRIRVWGGWPGARRCAPAWLTDLVGVERMEDTKVFDRVLMVNLKSATDARLAELTGLSHIDRLDVSDSDLTDAGMVHVGRMCNLQAIILNRTSLTDAGLAHLRNMTNLRDLYVQGTAITSKGKADFRRALPKCQVHSE